METYRVNGYEVEFDIFDLTNLELFESERNFAMKRAAEMQAGVTDGNALETLHEMCEIVRDFFDVVLGVGISNKIFGARRNVMTEMSALTKFLQDVSDVMDRAKTQILQVESNSPTRPPMNRQQRREAERKAEREKRRQEAAQRAKSNADTAGSSLNTSVEA